MGERGWEKFHLIVGLLVLSIPGPVHVPCDTERVRVLASSMKTGSIIIIIIII